MSNTAQCHSAMGKGEATPRNLRGAVREGTTNPATHTPLRPLLYKACMDGRLTTGGFTFFFCTKACSAACLRSTARLHCSSLRPCYSGISPSILLPLLPRSSHPLFRRGNPAGTGETSQAPRSSFSLEKERAGKGLLRITRQEEFQL